jgi:hypothetical protein
LAVCLHHKELQISIHAAGLRRPFDSRSERSAVQSVEEESGTTATNGMVGSDAAVTRGTHKHEPLVCTATLRVAVAVSRLNNTSLVRQRLVIRGLVAD